MTKAEVFAMAHTAWGDHHEIFWFDDDGIEKFAELVAAREREACAKVCEAWQEWGADGVLLAKAIRNGSNT